MTRFANETDVVDRFPNDCSRMAYSAMIDARGSSQRLLSRLYGNSSMKPDFCTLGCKILPGDKILDGFCLRKNTIMMIYLSFRVI